VYNAWDDCIVPLGQIYRSTWLGGQVASPRDKDKEGYPGITIDPKLTISGAAYYTLILQSTYPLPPQELESAREVLLIPANSGGQTHGGSIPYQPLKNRGA